MMEHLLLLGNLHGMNAIQKRSLYHTSESKLDQEKHLSMKKMEHPIRLLF